MLLPKPSEFDALSDYEPSDRNSAGQASPGSSMDIDGDEDERKWEWRFGLVLEDASDEQIPKGEGRAQVIVYVAEQDAEFLLKLDAEEYAHNLYPSSQSYCARYLMLTITTAALARTTKLCQPSVKSSFSSGVISKNARSPSVIWRS